MTLRRRDVVAALAAIGIAVVCVCLGVWQLDRLHQRRARNAEIAARLSLPPLELAGQGIPADSARQRRIRARGTYDYAHERVWPGRSFDGTPGVGLITPLRLPDGAAVLVDRGWVPSPDAYHVDRSAYQEPDTAAVEGLGAVPPRGRADVDLVRLRDSVPYALLPFVVQLMDASPPRGLPRRWPSPVRGDGPHLWYAIQWFSFAVIIVVGTWALLRQVAQQPTPSISTRL
ncbi:MAG TPA: SURF1 family protein [Gemmatimonadales bacterium]|jgi:surfeit locus 1 family protein|nr:SURF1 family protein [Gemmatimonadales bacterium]